MRAGDELRQRRSGQAAGSLKAFAGLVGGDGAASVISACERRLACGLGHRLPAPLSTVAAAVAPAFSWRCDLERRGLREFNAAVAAAAGCPPPRFWSGAVFAAERDCAIAARPGVALAASPAPKTESILSISPARRGLAWPVSSAAPRRRRFPRRGRGDHDLGLGGLRLDRLRRVAIPDAEADQLTPPQHLVVRGSRFRVSPARRRDSY